MYTSIDKQVSNIDEPVWYFLAEYSLGEIRAGMDFRHEPVDILLLQIIRELGIPEEHLSNIQNTLAGFVTQAIASFQTGGAEPPVYIRLFCQKMVVRELNSANSSSQFASGQPLGSAQIIHCTDPEINGGWGYFLVERSVACAPGASACTYKLVDLYLYKEGE